LAAFGRGDLLVQNTIGTRNVETKTRVFISYSRKDMAFADRLESALKGRGFEVLIDRQEIYAFEDWWKRIQALIGQSDTVVFVLSPDSVKSDVALKEVAHAASLNKRFAPIVCRHVEDSAVPEALRRLNFIFFDDPSLFDASADKLVDAFQTDIGWVRKHTEYGERAREWMENAHAAALLLRPPLLDQAETWLALRPTGAPAPTAETERYFAESRRADIDIRLAEAKTKRRWRFAQAAIFVLLVGIILGLVGWINQASIADQWRYWTLTWPYARAQVRPYVLTQAKEQALKSGQSFKECARDCPEMVVVPAGTFAMGSPQTDKQADTSEFPQHTVSIARPFAVSIYELTFADWDACVAAGGCNGYKPSDESGRGERPVINVSWNDTQAYVAWLSLVTGKTYQLLSEAEYEYAARAGATTEYLWGNDVGKNNSSCNGCGSQWDNKQTAPVGSFPPNKFGLYDMVGNVWEWTEDCYHASYEIDTPQGKLDAPADGSAWTSGDCSSRVVRGGSYDSNPRYLRSAGRAGYFPDDRSSYIGFRVGRTLLAP
jgi:formylglycine-generating enzyme required for sulfatase activity